MSPTTAQHDPGRRRTTERTISMVIGGAGAVGALVRYSVGLALPTTSGQFPWGTFCINLTGCFIIGVVLVLLTEHFPRARLARPLIVTGFLGAYTTFSTYSVDSDLLVRDHHIGTAITYALSSLLVGILAVAIGGITARSVVRLEHRLNQKMSQ